MKSLFLLLPLCLLVPACSEDDPTAPAPDPVPQTTLDAVLQEAGMVSPLAAERDDVTTAEEVEGDFRYIYETHDAVENLDSVTCLGLNDDVIWPGSLVRGDQAYNYVYEPIMAPRAPITLSISLEGAGVSGLSEVVTSPMLSTVRQGIANLVTRALEGNASVPAQVDWDYQQVYSASQMSLFVDADVTYGAGSLAASFNWDESSTTNKIMAKYTQIYYSVDMDTPADARAVLAADISEAQLRAAFPSGSRPLYVAGVKYGMMAIMCIETEFTMSEMQAALDVAYGHGPLDAELSFGYTTREVLSSSSIRIIVYGGSTSGIEELTGIDGFLNIIAASTNFSADSPGVPLVYKFRHLCDNTLAFISLTSQYTVCRPVRIRQGVRVMCTQFHCVWSDDEDGIFYDNKVDIDRLSVWCNAFNRLNAGDPGVQFNPANQSIFYWQTSGYYEMDDGDNYTVNEYVDLYFDTENYNFDYARLDVGAMIRDYDWTNGNETAWGSITLYGSGMLGAHSIPLYETGMSFNCELIISLINN